jgi:hypothetical protein
MTTSHFRRVLLVALLTIGSVGSVRAQDGGDDQIPLNDWITDAIGKLSFTQSAYENWSEGGLNTLAFTTGIDAKARRRSETWEQVHELHLAYGLIRQDTLDFRKADDIIRLASQLQYEGNGFFNTFNPTLAAQMRTQFAPGYNYDEVPSGLSVSGSLPVKVSDFFSPAIIQQSLGLTYDPDAWFAQRVGLGLKETVVLIERLRPVYYGENSDELGDPLRFEVGLESHTEVDREVFENVRLKSALDLFYAYNQLEEPPDAFWTNIISLGVNEWLSVNFEGTFLYDQNIDDRPQLKEVLSIGISYTLL